MIRSGRMSSSHHSSKSKAAHHSFDSTQLPFSLVNLNWKSRVSCQIEQRDKANQLSRTQYADYTSSECFFNRVHMDEIPHALIQFFVPVLLPKILYLDPCDRVLGYM
jgi:hypothetical protein